MRQCRCRLLPPAVQQARSPQPPLPSTPPAGRHAASLRGEGLGGAGAASQRDPGHQVDEGIAVASHGGRPRRPSCCAAGGHRAAAGSRGDLRGGGAAKQPWLGAFKKVWTTRTSIIAMLMMVISALMLRLALMRNAGMRNEAHASQHHPSALPPGGWDLGRRPRTASITQANACWWLSTHCQGVRAFTA